MLAFALALGQPPTALAEHDPSADAGLEGRAGGTRLGGDGCGRDHHHRRGRGIHLVGCETREAERRGAGDGGEGNARHDGEGSDGQSDLLEHGLFLRTFR
jgi:hypothetical protein